MEYRAEVETMEGEFQCSPFTRNLPYARRKAARMSRAHMIAYVVAFEGEKPIGHVSYANGVVSEKLGYFAAKASRGN